MQEKGKLKGTIKIEAYRDGELLFRDEVQNLIVDEGLAYALDSSFVGGAVTSWYVGLLNNSTPTAAWTLANAAAAEVVAYSEGNRPAWTKVRTDETITNTASKAKFTISVTTTDIYGAFLTSSSVKSGSSGKLFGAGQFGTPRTGLNSGDEVYITYQIDAASA